MMNSCVSCSTPPHTLRTYTSYTSRYTCTPRTTHTSAACMHKLDRAHTYSSAHTCTYISSELVHALTIRVMVACTIIAAQQSRASASLPQARPSRGTLMYLPSRSRQRVFPPHGLSRTTVDVMATSIPVANHRALGRSSQPDLGTYLCPSSLFPVPISIYNLYITPLSSRPKPNNLSGTDGTIRRNEKDPPSRSRPQASKNARFPKEACLQLAREQRAYTAGPRPRRIKTFSPY